MKRELLGMKKLTIEGNSGNRLHDLNLLLCEGECICLVSASHHKELLVEYLQGGGRTISGSIFLHGKEIFPNSKAFMEKEKIFVIGCGTPYMNTLTIGENIFLLRRNSLKKFRLNESAMELQTRYYLDQYGIDMDLNADSDRLAMADKIIIGVIRSISQGAGVIVLSDISRAFFGRGMDRLLSLIQGMKAEGIGVLVSDNHPEYFYSAADQLVIFKHKQIAKKIYEPSEFGLAHEILMKGTVPAARDPQKSQPDEVMAVEIKGFMLDGKPCSIWGTKGDIVLVSVAGMERIWEQFMRFPGRGTSGRALTYVLDGKEVPYKTMTDLIHQKIAFINSEISYGGMLENLSSEDNILMPSFRKISSKLGFYKKQSKYIFQDDFLFNKRVRFFESKSLCEDADTLFFKEGDAPEDLGREGNGWKAVLYRWKLYHPKVLILYNVLTVADAQQRDWITTRLMELAGRGTTVILLENDSSYCAAIADRIETMKDEDTR